MPPTICRSDEEARSQSRVLGNMHLKGDSTGLYANTKVSVDEDHDSTNLGLSAPDV